MYKNIIFTLCLSVCGTAFSQGNTASAVQNPKHNIIQLALLLDVSGSMQGLINQAKSELWNIVNEVAKADKHGYSTKLEIALYEYGRGAGNRNDGYMFRHFDFISDLDSISEVLFSLKITGSDEYCGHVIRNAVQDLQWRNSDSVYKVIFIAGNEEFTQGGVNYKLACAMAAQQHIIVNTIHCGDSLTGIKGFWKNGADIAKGNYFFINSNKVDEDPNTPYDSTIASYNDSLNATYWEYGYVKKNYALKQKMQDNNAWAMNKKSFAKRAESKSVNKMYMNTTWDAVDKANTDSKWLDTAKDAELPDSLKNKTITQRKLMISKNDSLRKKFQRRIVELNKKRTEFIVAEKKRIAEKNAENKKENTLSDAIIHCLHEQGEKHGFNFKKE